MVCLNSQSSIDNKGKWVKVIPDKPDNIVSLEVNESFIGVFVSRKENTDSKFGGFFYTLERESGELATMFSTTDLDRSMRKLESGDRIKVSRLKDQPMPPPKQPMQKYVVERWEGG